MRRSPQGFSSTSRTSTIFFSGAIVLLLLNYTTSHDLRQRQQQETAEVEERVDANTTIGRATQGTSDASSSILDNFVIGTPLPVNNTCLTASGNQRGCSFPVCEEWVCDQFDSCCEIGWTDTCVETALRNATLCFFVPPTRENNCFTTDPFHRPGCADETCEAVVCELAPTCCTTSYGQSCIDLAVVECNLPVTSPSIDNNINNDQSGSCFERSKDGGPGCSDDTCLRAVCQQESSCCGIQYDEDCVEIARNLGPTICDPVEYDNTCLQTSPVGGCQEEDCEPIVCAIQPECCNSDTQTGRYDETCVVIASQSCPL
jgi:hypothetical protein